MKDISIFELRKITEAYERMNSKTVKKQMFPSLNERFPYVSDSDVIKVINYAIDNGFGDIRIVFVIGKRYMRKMKRGGDRETFERIGYLDSSKIDKIMKSGIEETDATDDIDLSLNEKVVKYLGNSELDEEKKKFYFKYSNLFDKNQDYKTWTTIECVFDGQKCFTPEYFFEWSMDNMGKYGIQEAFPDIAEKVKKGFSMVYGRDHSEVLMENSVLESIHKMGDSLGLEVDCEFGEMKSDYDSDDYDMDSEYNAYMSFKELYAIRQLLKFISTNMFHPAVGRFSKPVQTKEKSIEQIKDILSKFADREISGGWYGNTLQLSKKEFDDNVDEVYCREFGSDGAANVARIITSQSETIEWRMDEYIYEDLKLLSKYVKNGYHCGNCWSSNGYGFFDDGEWVIGMSYFTLQGKVFPNAINWEETFGTRSSFESEKELNIYSGCPIFEPSIKYTTNKIVLYIHPKDKNTCFIA